MVRDFRRDDLWTPAFAGVTLQETSYKVIMITIFLHTLQSVLKG
jgi:hypothetical protein